MSKTTEPAGLQNPGNGTHPLEQIRRRLVVLTSLYVSIVVLLSGTITIVSGQSIMDSLTSNLALWALLPLPVFVNRTLNAMLLDSRIRKSMSTPLDDTPEGQFETSHPDTFLSEYLGNLGGETEYAHEDSEPQQVPMQAFSLPGLLQNLMHGCASLAREKGLLFTVDIRPNVPERVIGQADLFRTVLKELLENTLKRTHEGEIFINVRTLEESGGQVFLRIEVGDSGVDSDENIALEMFADKKKRVHRCQNLVNKMGGQIGVHDGGRRGSTVWFTAMFQRQGGRSAVA